MRPQQAGVYGASLLSCFGCVGCSGSGFGSGGALGAGFRAYTSKRSVSMVSCDGVGTNGGFGVVFSFDFLLHFCLAFLFFTIYTDSN